MTLSALLLALALQDAPVSTAPQAEPPPPVELVPAQPLAVPPPPVDPIEALLGTDEDEAEGEPPAIPPPSEAPTALPPGPQPYQTLPGAPPAQPPAASPPPSLPVRPPATPPLLVPSQPSQPSSEPAPVLPSGPRPYGTLPAAPAPRPSIRPYEAPRGGYELPSVAEQAYESGVRGAAQAAQSRQGPLDGGWLVTGADGARLYFLQLTDGGSGAVEGAWRDANGLPGVRSGFITSALREGAGVTVRFYERSGREPVSLTLRPGADGRSWVGELDRRDGRRSITMRPQ